MENDETALKTPSHLTPISADSIIFLFSEKTDPLQEMYEERTYRNLVKTDDLVNFEVIVKETDLLVRAGGPLRRNPRIHSKTPSPTGKLYFRISRL